ncbi:hypothetical protein V2J09_020162 [Rumex salicifolius]
MFNNSNSDDNGGEEDYAMNDGKSGSSTNARKRKRDNETEIDCQSNHGGSLDLDDSRSLEESLTFSDTLIALRMMRAQFPILEKVSIKPFMLRSQLYSSVKDRTQVDRELELLKQDKVLRVFKLNTGQDDHAIMFSDDYINQIDYVVDKMPIKEKEDRVVFDWFKTHVITCKLDPGIEHQELCLLLSAGGKVKDQHISLLINAGVLTRQLIDPNMYWFSIPSSGSILKGLSQGRKELLSFMNRRKYKEMMLASLEKKRLRNSPLDIRFHLRDLIGSGHLKTSQTTTGIVVRDSFQSQVSAFYIYKL